MKRMILGLMVVIAVAMFGGAAEAGVKDTKHNLGSTGAYTFKSADTTEICIFCHFPHNSRLDVPLWNRSLQDDSLYELYTSSATLTSAAANTSGITSDNISFRCLGCHDGSIGLGAGIDNTGGVTIDAGPNNGAVDSALTGRANLGRDLTNDHPIAFRYTIAENQDTDLVGSVVTPGGLRVNGELPLFAVGTVDGYIECASCHNVHDNTFAPFLRKTNDSSALCLTCHNK